jgi:DNA primase
MAIDTEALLARHSLSSVLRRCGLFVPDPGPGVRDEWRSHCPLPGHPPPAVPGRSKASFAAHLQGRMAGRWHCFACETGGDAISLVQAFSQVGFKEAVGLLEAGGRLPRGNDPHVEFRPARRGPGGALSWDVAPGSDQERPDPLRTSPDRLAATLAEAWSYYSLPGLCALARRRLSERGIDLSALEDKEHRVLAGHTPRSRTGLSDHLRRRGFSDDEAVDAGLVSRHADGRVEDLFTHRLLLPVRGAHGQVVGLIGRDVSGGERAKYLNSPTTALYDKSRDLYFPSRQVGRVANLVVVEGVLDALAIDAAAAAEGREVAAVATSGVALTLRHRHQLAARSAGPPVLCADGDAAGRAATARWVTELSAAGQEVAATVLPEPFDPADWLADRGPEGLSAFVRRGCLEAGPGELRPVHAGRFLAERLAAEGHELGPALATLGGLGAGLRNAASRRRFAEQAALGLARAGLGPDGWLERALLARVEQATSEGPTAPTPAVGREVGV